MSYSKNMVIACLGSLFVLASCHRDTAPQPVRLEPAPIPSVDATGGPTTEFYFEYFVEGGYHGARPQLLVVTSEPSIAPASTSPSSRTSRTVM